MKILAFAGSLREKSYNKMLVQAAIKLCPKNMMIENFNLITIPPFNQDLELAPPNSVIEFKKKIAQSDGILIATPEYNYSIPGVLKNAIDWASRPYSENPFSNKPVALMGATIGGAGTIKAQFALRQCFVFLNMHPLNHPEVYVSHAQDKFDSTGSLTDQKTIDNIKSLLDSLNRWTERLK